MIEDEEDEGGSDDEFIVDAFQEDSESRSECSEDEDPTFEYIGKRKLPDGSQGNAVKKQRPSPKVSNARVEQLQQWAERSISLMLNLRLQLYKVFEQDDENVQKRAWKKIASMLFPLKVTGEHCLQRFNSLMEKYLASYDPNVGAVACSAVEEEHFQFIEKLLRKSPKIRHQYLSAGGQPSADSVDPLDVKFDPDNTRSGSTFLGYLAEDESTLAQSYRQLVEIRQREKERDKVFEEIIEDIISMQERKRVLERKFLSKFVSCEFETRDAQLGMFALTLMCVGCADSVPVGELEHIRREINKRTDKGHSISVLMAGYWNLLEQLFDEPDEEYELWFELLPDSSHFFVPPAALANHVVLTEFGFKGLIRMERTTVEKVIEIFGPSAPPKIGNFKPLSVERVVLLSLWFLIHDETFDQLSIRFSIRESDVRQAIRTFVRILSDPPDLIQWPENLSDIKKTVLGFENMRDASFPGVVGALGTKLFRVRSPDIISEKDLLAGTHLLDYDIGVQAVADSKHVFRSVAIKWILEEEQGILLANVRKRMLDDGLNWHKRVPEPSHMFLRTGLCNMLARRNDKWVEEKDMAFLPDDLHVLGDSSYPLLVSLMVPFDPESDLKPREFLFNKQWELSWSVVGKAFGKAINRFQRLGCLDYSLRNCSDTIKVIFAVHNICMKEGDNYPAQKVTLNDFPTRFPEKTPKPEAVQKRHNIMNEFVYEKIDYAYRGKLQVRSVLLK